MLNLKKGDVLVGKNYGEKRTVILALDGITFAQEEDGDSGWWTDEQLQKNFTLPTEKWVPQGNYYYVNVLVHEAFNRGYDSDKGRIETGNCFRAREEAEAKAEEIRKVFKK